MITAFGEILFDVYPKKELLGGAPFNFLIHTHALTGSGIVISRIGNDDRGAKVRAFLEHHSVDQQHIQIDTHRPTGTAHIRLNDDGIPAFTIAEETAYDFIESETGTMEAIEGCDMLYFGTLAQRSEISRATLYELSQSAERCFFDVNLRQHYYSNEILQRSFVLADIVKLNVEELETIHSLFFSPPFTLESAATQLMEKFSLSHLAVTMGEKGSWMWTPETKHHYHTEAKNVRDTVGAGDAFAAMMCLGIMRGWKLEMMHKRASEFSAEICGIDGALPQDDSMYEQYKKNM